MTKKSPARETPPDFYKDLKTISNLSNNYFGGFG